MHIIKLDLFTGILKSEEHCKSLINLKELIHVNNGCWIVARAEWICLGKSWEDTSQHLKILLSFESKDAIEDNNNNLVICLPRLPGVSMREGR